MIHKDKIRLSIDLGIAKALEADNPKARMKSLLGMANVVAEFDTYLALLLGEQIALIEIERQQGKSTDD